MRKLTLYLVFFLLTAWQAYSQQLQSKAERKDSIVTSRLDSIKIPHVNKLFAATDTLSVDEFKKIDSAWQHTNKKIDSLQALRLPTDKYTQKLDSLSAKLRDKINIQHRRDSLSGSLRASVKKARTLWKVCNR